MSSINDHDRLADSCKCVKDKDFKSVYLIEEEVGRGRFAKVCKVKHKSTNIHYAAKIIRRCKNGVDTIASIHREAEILRLAGNVSSIVNILDVYESKPEVTLLLEYSAGGDLYHLVLRQDDNLTEGFVLQVMRQLLDAVISLHSMSVVHLDIKPENILLKRPFPCSEIALCDFGLAKMLDETTKVRDLVGTPDYVAPEILDYEPIELASDLWSIGVVTYYLLTSISPFNSDTKEETYSKVSKVTIDYPDDLFEDISKDAINFIQRLIRKNPKDRLSAIEAVEHSWLCSVPSLNSHPQENGHLELNGSKENCLPPDEELSHTSSQCDLNGFDTPNAHLNGSVDVVCDREERPVITKSPEPLTISSYRGDDLINGTLVSAVIPT